MHPMLDDIELPQVQEIRTVEKRVLAEHKPPGMQGSLLQNMGRRPMRLLLSGVKTGADALDFVEQLDDKFKEGEAMSFVADIVTDVELEHIVIDDLKWQELAGKPQRYAYVLVLREYIEPTEPEDASVLDQGIVDEAQGLMDDLVDGLDLGLDLPTGLDQFVEPLSGLLERLQTFRSAIDEANNSS